MQSPSILEMEGNLDIFFLNVNVRLFFGENYRNSITTEKYLRYFASCNLRMLASLVQFKLEDSDMDVSWVEDDPLIYQLLAVLPTNPEVPLQLTILAEK